MLEYDSKLKIGSLFAGIGGFDLGLERTGGFETAWFCEIEEYPTKILNQWWPDTPVYPDVTKLKGDEVEPIDILVGGFPCQDISAAGRGAGIGGDRSSLWFEFARLVGELRPRYVIAENSPLLKTRGLNAVLGSLAEIGYDAEWDCVPARTFGAPHQRDRIWVVAYPGGEGLEGHGSAVGDAPEVAQADCAGGAREAGRGDSDATNPDCEPAGLEESGAGGQEREPAGARESAVVRQENRAPASEGSRAGAGTHELADSEREGLQGTPGPRFASEGREAIFAPSESERPFGTWPPEPDLPRVAHGVPDRVDRVKALGNALVPVIPEYIGLRILEWEAELDR